MKKLSLLDKILYAINSLMAGLLLFSYLFPYISPSSIPLVGVLSLFVPFLFIINIGFIIYWLAKFKKQVFISLAITSFGWVVASPLFKFSDKKTQEEKALKIISYNVKMFNHLKWSSKKNLHQKIISFIKNSEPDILAIQENMFLPKYAINFPYKYEHKTYTNGNIGLAIYSKYRIIKKGGLKFEKPTSNGAIYIDIIKLKDTIRVYNLHLQSLKISTNEQNFGNKNSEELVNSLKYKFKQQAEQVELFLAHENKWKAKKIICGDLNNTAYSWAYKQISKNKKDAFIEAGKGFGKTYRYWFPMRIDYIFTDSKSIVHKFNIHSKKYSDHYPIEAKVSW